MNIRKRDKHGEDEMGSHRSGSSKDRPRHEGNEEE